MKSTATLAIALTLGLAVGAVSERISIQSAASAQNMPMAKATSMQGSDAMMKMGKSAADKEMMGAMMRMHQSMMSMKMTGNPDKDFMMMMIPHHRAAIDMAKVELKYGKGARVKGLARAIISAQQNEISEMSKWLNM